MENEAAEIAYRHGNDKVADKRNYRHGDDVTDSPQGVGVGDLEGIAELVGYEDVDEGGNHGDDFCGIGKQVTDDFPGEEEEGGGYHGEA